MTMVWPSFLLGEARRRLPEPAPKPVFVAVPTRLRAAGNREANPGEGRVVAWLHRCGSETEPTHAEVPLRPATPRGAPACAQAGAQAGAPCPA